MTTFAAPRPTTGTHQGRFSVASRLRTAARRGLRTTAVHGDPQERSRDAAIITMTLCRF